MQTEAKTRNTPSRDVDAEVGRRVHMLMWDRQMTQTALGNILGIDQSSLAKKLRGQRKWALADLVAAADALGVSAGELLDGAPRGPQPVAPDTTEITRG